MICFDVYVNGKKLCRAGLREAVVMTCMLDWTKLPSKEEEMFLRVGGLYIPSSGGNAHPRWLEDLSIREGDEITIKVIDSDEADDPIYEEVYTPEDIRKGERNYFESVKAKFESDDD